MHLLFTVSYTLIVGVMLKCVYLQAAFLYQSFQCSFVCITKVCCARGTVCANETTGLLLKSNTNLLRKTFCFRVCVCVCVCVLSLIHI